MTTATRMMLCALLLQTLAACTRNETSTVPATAPDTAYLFSYFKDNGEDGVHLAYSLDGLSWQALNDDQPYLAPAVGESKLMRDPSIVQGPDGVFHMVWTAGWKERGIGYAHSRDLVHWSEQKYIPVMAHEQKARNCWAPELFYDAQANRYLIVWSTTIPGRFRETDHAYRNREDDIRNHRLYYVTTRDFTQFSETRLFFDPGHSVIDGALARHGDQYVLFYKDETEAPPQKNIKLALSDAALGPYVPTGGPITGDYWAEGPTFLRIEGAWYIYFDKYRRDQFGAVKSADLVHWTDISDRVRFPTGMRQGTAFQVAGAILKPLL